jgi:hypothetical protein
MEERDKENAFTLTKVNAWVLSISASTGLMVTMGHSRQGLASILARQSRL